MTISKKKQAVAGYHMLMILTAVDGKFNAKEDLVIKEWMDRKFPPFANYDQELEIISTMPEDQYFDHFKKCMDDFYTNSTEADRNELIQLAVNLTKADKKISREENIYLDELFIAWTEIEQ